LLKWPGAGLL